MSTEELIPLSASVDIYWLPLGAGDNTHGRILEWVAAQYRHREPLDLYHAALEVRTGRGRFVIEMAPVWSTDVPNRRTVGEGPVGLMRGSRILRWLECCGFRAT